MLSLPRFRTLALRALARAPLLPFAAGLWLGCAVPAPSLGWLIAPALLGLVWPRGAVAGLGQLVIGSFLGAFLARAQPAPICPEATAGPGSKTTQWLGRVLSLEPSRDARSSLVLELLAGRRGQLDIALDCRVLVSVGRRFPEVLIGDLVWLPAVDLEPPVHLINPGSGDTADSLTERGIERVGSLADGAGVLALEPPPPLTRWMARLRSAAESRIAALPPGEGRDIVRALGLGERGAVAWTLEDSLRDSGLRHLLSLGLLYVSIWAAIVAAPMKALWSRRESLALRLPARRAAAIATLPVPCLYGLLGNGPTAFRAMVVGGTVAVAASLGRRVAHPLHLFSLGLTALLCLAPREATRPALFWSAAALAGICGLAGPALEAIGKRERSGQWSRPRAELWRVLAIGAAAFAATAPLQLALSSRLPWLGIPLTPLGLGLSVPAMLLAQGGLLGGSGVLLRAALEPAKLLAALAVSSARIGAAYLPVPAAAALGAGLLWVAALAACLRRRLTLGALLLALGAIAVLGPHALSAIDRAVAPRLRLTFLSVGHGDSTVIETPHGLAILIDGGGSVVGDFDPGREIVVPFLESRGIRRLEAVILTHPHPDHANGLPSVLRALEVGEVWESGEPCPLPACAEIAALERTRGTRHLRLGTERFARSIDGVELALRSPQLPGGYDPSLGPNDNSLVFQLTFGKLTALLTGDIEASAEERLLAQGTELGAFLLKAPHHGSDTSSTPAFVSAVHPAAVIFSVGPRNRFNFPRPAVTARYAAAGTRSFRTDQDGAVMVESDGARVWIRSAVPSGPSFAADLNTSRSPIDSGP